MKKFLAILLLVLTLSLASCKGDEEVVALVDNPNTEIAEALGLANVTASINSSLSTESGSYIDVKISTNLNDSLVVRNVSFDKFLSQFAGKIQSANISSLTFVAGIDSVYQASIMSELYNETYGITAEKLGLNVEIINNTSFSTSIAIAKAEELYNAGEDNIYCSIIYLPIRALIYQEGQNVLSVYVLIPVYAEFGIYENNTYANAVFNGYDVINYSVDNNNVLFVAE